MAQAETPNDALLNILLNVIQELWVVKDRQLILEAVLQEAGIDAAAAVDDYQPSAELTQQLQAARTLLLEKCLAPANDLDAAE